MRIKIKKNNHYRFYALLTVLIILLFIRYALQIDIPRIVLTTIIIIIAACGNRNEILTIAMCCMPLHEAVDLYYSITACIVAYVLKNPKNIRINSGVFVGLIMIIWEVLHCFEPNFSPKLFLVSIIPLLFLMMLMCADVSTVDYGFVIRTMGVVLASTCISLLLNLIIKAGNNFTVAFSQLRRLGEVSDGDVMIGGAINPNSLGIICVLVISGCLQLRSIEKNEKSDIVLMLILLIFGTLTSSRTFIICLTIMAVLFIMGQRGTISKKIYFLTSLCIFAGLALIILNCLFPDLLEFYISRFKVEDITTGRDDLMKIYHRYIINNPKIMFWGIGVNEFIEKLVNIYDVANNGPHNSIQELIVAWGIPGVIMFVMLGVTMLNYSTKYSKKHVLLNYIPIIIIAIKSMAGQLLTSSYTMLALSFAYLSLCQNFRQAEV